MHRLSCVLIIILLCTELLPAQVQVRARADNNNILIGQPVNYSIEAYLPLNATIQWPQTDTIPQFEILSIMEVDSSDKMEVRKISQSFMVTSYDTGLLVIPPVQIIVNKIPYFTDSVFINVSYADFNPAEDYRDIRSIIEVPHPYAKYIPWILGIMAVFSAIAGIWFLSRKQKSEPVVIIESTTLSPLEKAIMKLNNLKQNPNDPVKYYYASLNEILKEYLHEAFDIHTTDKTNTEILENIKRMNIQGETSERLRKSLELSDYVKFAKQHPDEKINAENKNIIIQTITMLDKYKLQ